MPRNRSTSSATPKTRGRKKKDVRKQTSLLDEAPKPSKPKAEPKEWVPRVPAPEEALTDGELIVSFTIPGQPATKKTSQRIFRGRIMPSVQYCEYESRVAGYCLSAWVGQGASAEEWQCVIDSLKDELKKAQSRKDKAREAELKALLSDDLWKLRPEWVTQQPIDCGVVMRMRVYLHTWQVGDCTGYQQSIADIIQKYGVLANDSWLHWDWDGEHWFGGVDKENPRVEVTLKRYRHPKEEYRANQEAEELAKQERTRVRAEKAVQKAQKATAEGEEL